MRSFAAAYNVTTNKVETIADLKLAKKQYQVCQPYTLPFYTRSHVWRHKDAWYFVWMLGQRVLLLRPEEAFCIRLDRFVQPGQHQLMVRDCMDSFQLDVKGYDTAMAEHKQSTSSTACETVKKRRESSAPKPSSSKKCIRSTSASRLPPSPSPSLATETVAPPPPPSPLAVAPASLPASALLPADEDAAADVLPSAATPAASDRKAIPSGTARVAAVPVRTVLPPRRKDECCFSSSTSSSFSPSTIDRAVRKGDDTDPLASEEYRRAVSILSATERRSAAESVQSPDLLPAEEVYKELLAVVLDGYSHRIDAAVVASAHAYESFAFVDGKDRVVIEKDLLTETIKIVRDGGGQLRFTASPSGKEYVAQEWLSGHSIRVIAAHTGEVFTALCEPVVCGMTRKERDAVLYGHDSPVKLTDEMLDRWRQTTNFRGLPSFRMEKLFAELGERFGQLLDDQHAYILPAGTKGNAEKAPSFPHSDGLVDFMSELWIKPSALSTWLDHAFYRGYSSARIVCHGTSRVAVDRMRSHAFGLCLDMGGANGQVYGKGFYFGLCPKATYGYITHAPKGSYVVGLLLTKETDERGFLIEDTTKQAWYHRGGKGAPTHTTFPFGADRNVDNAVAVHDPQLVLTIGFLHSFDDAKGWE